MDTGEFGGGIGRPRDSCLLFEGIVSYIKSLNELGEKHNLRWNTSPPIASMQFPFKKFLDYNLGKTTEIEDGLAKQIQGLDSHQGRKPPEKPRVFHLWNKVHLTGGQQNSRPQTPKDLYILHTFAFGEYNSKQVNVSNIQHFLTQF